ncbi:MAG: gluconokinase [Cereibacter changlensis]
MRLVLMGVAGSGKTSVGQALAARIGIAYRDGDDLHPPGNIARMARGEPLTDEDRWPWLARVGQALAAEEALILGCSALKRAYRDRIRDAAGEVIFVHLSGSRRVIAARMRAREGHFMPASLLDSQFAALEPPGPDEASVTVDIDQPVEAVVSDILRGLQAMRTR